MARKAATKSGTKIKTASKAKKATRAKPAKAAKTVRARKTAELAAEDQQVIRESVEFINSRMDGAANSLVEIGRHLLTAFFGGDVEKARQNDPVKPVSLRKLAAHPDLKTSPASLSRAVALAVQETDLGTVVSIQQLSATHKIALLSVKDLDVKREYAVKALGENLSVNALRQVLVAAGHIEIRGMGAVLESRRGFYLSGFGRIALQRKLVELA